jgi:hypothetical protein
LNVFKKGVIVQRKELNTFKGLLMDWTAATYVAYLLVTVALTIWVARTLSRNGQVFLEDVFEDRLDLANAVNKLLVVGFYLLNLGFVLLYLRSGHPVSTLSQMLESLSARVGIVMLVLGAVHFLNIYVFNSIRRRSRAESLRVPPVPPQGWVPPQGGAGLFGPHPQPAGPSAS